jgi:nucleotidyltransferase/DNA polymerase involved in DNA repair
MSSSGMLRRVALVRTDVSEEHSASIIRVTRIGELGMLAITINRRMLQRNTSVDARGFSETSVLARATRSISVYWGQLSRFRRELERESILRKVLFKIIERTIERAQNCDSHSNAYVILHNFPAVNVAAGMNWRHTKSSHLYLLSLSV